MLAKTYIVDPNTPDKTLVIKANPKEQNPEYLTVYAKDFCENSGFHHFSLFKDDVYKSSFPFFMNKSILDYLSPTKKDTWTYISNEFLEGELTEKQFDQFKVDFSKPYSNGVGVLKFRGKDSGFYLSNDTQSTITVDPNTSILVKIAVVGNYPIQANLPARWNNGRIKIGFASETSKNGQSIMKYKRKLDISEMSNNDWKEYTFVIYNDYDYIALDISLGSISFSCPDIPDINTTWCLAYLDIIKMPNEYFHLWNYSLTDNKTLIKHGAIVDPNFIESDRFLESMTPGIIFKAKTTTRTSKRSKKKGAN